MINLADEETQRATNAMLSLMKPSTELVPGSHAHTLINGLLAKLWRHVFPNDVKPIPSAKTTDVTLEQGGYLCPRCDGFSVCFAGIRMVD